MGLLFVFFPKHPDDEDPPSFKRRPSFSLSSSSSSSSAITNASLLSKAQSTLSICALLFFITLLLFSLFPPFEPTTAVHHHPAVSHRRALRQISRGSESHFLPPALQGMGALYRRGTKAMTDLVVGHVAEGAKEREFVTFLRLVHLSGLLSRADLVLIFESSSLASRLGRVVRSESDSFLRLVRVYRELNSSVSGHGLMGRGLNRYLRPVGEEEKEALWGKKVGNSIELSRGSYGSVVGFDASELDPENSLSGFLGQVPMSLRRWACYPMLLGRVRRNYKHTALIDVRNSLILSDPFARVRNRSTESVLLWPTESTRTNPAESTQLNPAVTLGGGRGVRRFAAVALTEIVRVAVERKGKGRNSVTESRLVTQLVHSGHLLKNVNLMISDESIPEASSLGRVDYSSGPSLSGLSDYFAVVQRGQSGGSGSFDVDSVVRRETCSSHELFSTVYTDCLASQ